MILDGPNYSYGPIEIEKLERFPARGLMLRLAGKHPPGPRSASRIA